MTHERVPILVFGFCKYERLTVGKREQKELAIAVNTIRIASYLKTPDPFFFEFLSLTRDDLVRLERITKEGLRIRYFTAVVVSIKDRCKIFFYNQLIILFLFFIILH